MGILRALRWVVILLAAIMGGMVSTNPKEAESNAAKWLDSVGFSSWGESFTPAADDWILAGCIAVALLLACSFFIPRARRNHADAAAIKQSPGNGWRVSRRMMNLWSMRKVEALCQDFLAQPHKTDEARVLAARAIRQHRAEGGTERGSWEFWSGLEAAMQNLGEEAVTQAITALDEEFPPSWWRKRRMIHAAAREARMFRLERQRETETQPSPSAEKLVAEEVPSDGKEVAKLIKESGPNWTMPELIQHMYKAGNDLSRCVDEIHDKARLEQLSVWGKKYSAASPHENPNPLRPIPANHWDHYCLDTLQCAYAEDASASCTEPRSSNFSEHDYNGAFQGLRVNRSQAMAHWPSNEGEET